MRKRWMMNENSLSNLRPFGTLPPDEQSELSRRGGVASGKRRREIAEAVDYFNDAFFLMTLRDEKREHFLKALRLLAAREYRKRKRRKPN